MVPWETAFETRYTTDAHVSIYSLEEEDAIPRINKAAHQWLIEQGKEPQVGWAFIDVDNENHRAWESQEEKQRAVEALVENTFLEDAGIYTTRAGYRLVWRLETPVPARHWQSWYKQFREYLIANGVPVDTSETLSAWSTSFRLPWVTRDGRRTEPAVDLTPLQDGYTLQWSPEAALRVELGSSTAEIDTDQREVVPPTEEEWQSLLGASRASQYLHRLREGVPIGIEGNRDNVLFEVVGSIGGHLRCTDPNEIYKFIFQSVQADDREGAPSLENAWGKCCRIASLEAGKVEEREQQQDQQRPAAFLVHQDKHFYVLDTREDASRYRAFPVGGNMLVNALETYTQPGIPALQTRNQQGGPVTVRRLASDYGRAINQVIFVMGQDRAEYSPESGGTLHLGCCVPQVVEARRDEQIERWLEELAASKLDILLDWLATLTVLELPTCALYLKGKAGTGKSMLISALASVWGTKATPLQEMMSPFNAGLLECPVVAADEGITLTHGSMSPEIVFRNLVANSDHSINRKNMPVVRVQGCARVIICANNDRALQFNNSLTEEDLQAIVSRTLYIEAQEAAAKYLTKLGGRNATRNWVMDGNSPGRIAQHLAWLKENRTVRHGNRLVVEGQLEDWHRRFIVSVGINSQVLYIIAKVIAREGNSKSSCFRENEQVLVTTDTIIDKWDAYFPNAKTPTPRRLANSLSNISVGKRRRKNEQGRRIDLWAIPWASVESEAENLGIVLSTENIAKNRV